MKDDGNPMHKAHEAPRCTAHSKRTGEPCHAPAVTGWRVCRLHGAGGGHPSGKEHPSWKHGMRSDEWCSVRREMSELVRTLKWIDNEMSQQIEP